MWQLFWTFLKIGAFSFGGGYAMIPLIEREVIVRHKWIARTDFLDMMILAQSSPGPIALNTAVFIGYKTRGLGGALAAMLGIIIPSFTMILLIALLFADIRYNPWVDAAFKGMRPAVVALIVMPILALSKTVHRLMWIAIVATALAIHWLGWSPILLLVAGGLIGIGYELWNTKRLNR